MGSPKWSRRTPEKIAQQLDRFGIQVSATTVARLLKKMMGYSLRVNPKKVESGVRTPPDPKQRDQQFHYIDQQRAAFARRGDPTLSIDTKKKELIGNFKNNGRAWKKEAIPVNDHDYPSDAQGRMVPFGIYDPQANDGWVCVGDSADTPAFAVDSIERWWQDVGCQRYPQATDLLILADGGPANGPRSRVWHHQLQRQLCDPYGLTVTVLPLSARGVQVESHRASTLLGDQQKLGGGTPGELPHGAALHPNDNDGVRLAGAGAESPEKIPNRPDRRPGGHRRTRAVPT